MTRDDVKWVAGMVGGVAVGLAGSFDLFPWIPTNVQHAIALVAFVYSTVSAHLSTSPLPGKNDLK